MEVRKQEKSRYEPGEDSFLLLNAAVKWLEANARQGIRVLDMGTGSGFIIDGIARSLAERRINAELWASDIDEKPKLPKGVSFVRSDLFSSVHGMFDLVLFNPPYLPEAKEDRYLANAEKAQLVGGPKGNELTLRFLDQLPLHLAPDGTCLLLTSSVAHPDETTLHAVSLGLVVQSVAGESFPFERLSVFLMSRRK